MLVNFSFRIEKVWKMIFKNVWEPSLDALLLSYCSCGDASCRATIPPTSCCHGDAARWIPSRRPACSTSKPITSSGTSLSRARSSSARSPSTWKRLTKFTRTPRSLLWAVKKYKASISWWKGWGWVSERDVRRSRAVRFSRYLQRRVSW